MTFQVLYTPGYMCK